VIARTGPSSASSSMARIPSRRRLPADRRPWRGTSAGSRCGAQLTAVPAGVPGGDDMLGHVPYRHPERNSGPLREGRESGGDSSRRGTSPPAPWLASCQATSRRRPNNTRPACDI
jgi:hypothetical protein